MVVELELMRQEGVGVASGLGRLHSEDFVRWRAGVMRILWG